MSASAPPVLSGTVRVSTGECAAGFLARCLSGSITTALPSGITLELVESRQTANLARIGESVPSLPFRSSFQLLARRLSAPDTGVRLEQQRAMSRLSAAALPVDLHIGEKRHKRMGTHRDD